MEVVISKSFLIPTKDKKGKKKRRKGMLKLEKLLNHKELTKDIADKLKRQKKLYEKKLAIINLLLTKDIKENKKGKKGKEV